MERYIIDTDGTLLKCNPITPEDAVYQLAFEDENIKFAQAQLDARIANQAARRQAIDTASLQIPILAEKLNPMPIAVNPISSPMI